MKDELGAVIMIEFVALRPKRYSCLVDDGDGNEKAKGKKRCLIKQKLNLKMTKIVLSKST